MTLPTPRTPIRLATLALLASYATSGNHFPSPTPDAFSARAPGPPTRMERFLDSLLARMTLEEKLGQLTQPGAPDNHTGPAARGRRGCRDPGGPGGFSPRSQWRRLHP